MKKVLLAFIVFVLFTNYSFTQDLQKVSSLNQIDSLRTAFKGDVILFNFWASWCEPCVEEIPDLLKIRNDFMDRGLRIIFISLDFPGETETKLKPFLKKNEMNFTTYLGDFKNPDEIMEYFDKEWDGAIPATFIFDRKGQVQTKLTGSRDYDFFQEEITKLL